MAIYNEILAARFAKALVKLFSMKGENPTKQLSGEVIAVHPFLNGVENRIHEGWTRFGNVISITGGAAQFAAGRLRNPSGSGVVAVLESIKLASVTALLFNGNLQAASTDLGTTLTNSMRYDARGPSNSSLIVSDSTTLGAATGANNWQIAVPAAGTFELISTENQEVTILPGDAFTMGNNAAASALILGMTWRERPLEESERFL